MIRPTRLHLETLEVRIALAHDTIRTAIRVRLPSADPVEQLYRELEAKVQEYRPKDDLSVLEKAYRFASKCHEGQSRDSGESRRAGGSSTKNGKLAAGVDHVAIVVG